MWHRLLCFLRIRNEFDYAPPSLGPEVNHPYVKYSAAECCVHCGGGRLHAIHKRPYNPRRLEEVCGAAEGPRRVNLGYVEREH
jgi:hypothetical protein